MLKRLYNGTCSLDGFTLTANHFKPTQFKSKYIELMVSDCELEVEGTKKWVHLPNIYAKDRIPVVNDRTFLLYFHESTGLGTVITECAQGKCIFEGISRVRVTDETRFVVRIYEIDTNFSAKG